MDTNLIARREEELVKTAFKKMKAIKGLSILAENIEERLGIISFYIVNQHYNLIVQLLNDRFGIQVRGGCACAGTYGHYLLSVDWDQSHKITNQINQGDLSEKPGWVRLSLHPTMTNSELDYIIDSIDQVANNYDVWKKDYIYSQKKNEFFHKSGARTESDILPWFNL